MRPLVWMRAVRDARPRFTCGRLTVLLCLGLRMNPDGSGFASTAQLGDDASAGRSTVIRATGEARTRGYLLQTRRGHRISATVVVASEWQLTTPMSPATQGVTGDTLAQTQGVRTPTQGVTGDTPRALHTRGLSAAARASLNGATPEERDAVLAEIRRRKGPGASEALIQHIWRAEGEGMVKVLRADSERAAREAALRAGWLCHYCRNRNYPDAGTCRQCHEPRRESA